MTIVAHVRPLARKVAGVTTALTLGVGISLIPAGASSAAPTDQSEGLAKVLASTLLDTQLAGEGTAASGNPSAPGPDNAGIDAQVLAGLATINLPGISIPLIRAGGNNGVLDLGTAAGSGLLKAYSISDTPTHSIAASGAIDGNGALDVGAAGDPANIGATRADLTGLLDQLGLGGTTDQFVDQLSLELGAFGSRAEQTGAGPANRTYVAGNGKIVIHSPAAAKLANALATGDTQTVLDNAVTPKGVIGQVVGGVNFNVPLVGLGASLDAGPGTATLAVDLSGVAKSVLAKPLTSKDGIVTVDLSTGTIAVDLAKLVKGPNGQDLNGLDPNTQLLTAETINKIVNGVADALGGLGGSAATALRNAVQAATLTVTLPAKLTVGPVTSNETITVTGTLDSFAGNGPQPAVAITGDLGIDADAIRAALRTAVTDELLTPLQPVVKNLLTSTASDFEKTVNGLVTPVVDGLDPVLKALSRIIQVTINEQTMGDLGPTSSTVRALSIDLLPGAAAAATVDLASSTVRVSAAALTPTLNASPDPVRPGGTLTVDSKGWPPNTDVTIVYTDSKGNPIGAPHTVTTGADGTLTDTITVPKGTPAGPLTIVGKDGDGNTAKDTVTVSQPSISASPDPVQPGGQVVVVGTGWPPNIQVVVVIRDSNGNPVGGPHTVTTNANGGFSETFPIPTGTVPGVLTATASDELGNTATDQVTLEPLGVDNPIVTPISGPISGTGNNDSSSLPNTGTPVSPALVLAGLLLVVGGLALMAYRRRKLTT